MPATAMNRARHNISAALRSILRRGACCAILSLAASTPHAQPTSPRGQEEIEQLHQQDQERLRGATLIGSGDDITIVLPNGELIPAGREVGCSPPEHRAGLIKVDCTLLDGPAYYFDGATGELLETCSIWVSAPRRCPPKQWPIDIPGCDGQVSGSIVGTWRLYAVPTAGGFSLVSGGWSFTLTDDLMRFDLGGDRQLERSYKVLEQGDQRYTLEIQDEDSARTVIDVELAPCGLIIESAAVCDEFCQNMASPTGVPSDEQIREIARLIVGEQNEESVDGFAASIRASIEQGPQPRFEARAFFVGENFR